MSIRLYVLIGLLLIVIGYAVGYYTLPEKVITKTVTETKTITVVQHDTKTITVIKPDGTKVITVVDKSVDTTKEDQKQSNTKIVENGKPQWKVGVDLTPRNPQLGHFYGARVDRRILGPVFVGAFGNTDRTLGLSLGVEF